MARFLGDIDIDFRSEIRFFCVYLYFYVVCVCEKGQAEFGPRRKEMVCCPFLCVLS